MKYYIFYQSDVSDLIFQPVGNEVLQIVEVLTLYGDLMDGDCELIVVSEADPALKAVNFLDVNHSCFDLDDNKIEDWNTTYQGVYHFLFQDLADDTSKIRNAFYKFYDVVSEYFDIAEKIQGLKYTPMLPRNDDDICFLIDCNRENFRDYLHSKLNYIEFESTLNAVVV